MNNAVKFEKLSFSERLGSMIRVDMRRMLKSRLFYILIACALVIPVLMTVMMTMMDGTVSVDPQTGAETVITGPENAWQSIGAFPSDKAEQTSGAGAMGGMDVMSMCNVNMMFMLVAVFVCLFISDDFRSGYAKNLFSVRVKKSDYVISKTLAGFICGGMMLLFYLLGAALGGAISGLSFSLCGLSAANIVMCMLAKIFLMLVFVSIFVLAGVIAKQKAWLSICGSLGGGMLLFMTVPLITPLNSTVINLIMCIAGGVLFAWGLGAISNRVLKTSSLV